MRNGDEDFSFSLKLEIRELFITHEEQEGGFEKTFLQMNF